jgi:hypothetical protein
MYLRGVLFKAVLSFALLSLAGNLNFAGAQQGSFSLPAAQNNPEIAPQTEFELSIHPLPANSRIVLATPAQFSDKGQILINEIIRFHNTAVLAKGVQDISTNLRISTPKEFHDSTGMPQWTNALFYKGTIMLPLDTDEPLERTLRTVRHEYTHALIHHLSGGKCPGWLDEGLAEVAEGTVRPSLTASLKHWLTKNPPYPFTSLRGGFTKLKTETVAPAYAQSLFAAKSLINNYGMQRIASYLSLLKDTDSLDSIDIFQKSFGISEKQFEARANSSLLKTLQIQAK